MHLTEEALDRMVENSLSRLCPARRGKVEEYLRHLRLRGLAPWSRLTRLKAILELGPDEMPYEELREEDLASWVESGALEEITEGYLDGSGGRT